MKAKVKEFLESIVFQTVVYPDPRFVIIMDFLADNHPAFKKEKWTFDQFYVTRMPKVRNLILEARNSETKKWRVLSWMKCVKSKKISDQKISDQKISDQKISDQKISDQKISDQKISDQKRLVSSRKRLTSAMRHAIKDQVANFRNGAFGSRVCAMCRSMTRSLEVDHVGKLFCELRDDFINLFGRFENTFEKIPREFWYNSKCRAWCFKKTDAQFAEAWRKYHHRHATFRFLCSACNKKSYYSKK